mmetsp:Transcript_18852/g.27551  ORF Transcript_18852/g.27551 Transcript_18852/m.27551 type:complete len:137 (+) Transcript_18852:111-521(+)
MSLMDKMKKAGRTLVDTGAKTMLKTDVAFLEREIRLRKQKFGVEVYDCMELLEVDDHMPIEEKEQQIREAFDRARKDIAVFQAKLECKKEEIGVLQAEMAAAAASGDTYYNNNLIPPASGNVIMSDHPSELEYGMK